jgi:glycosyltransferase involved in cell wall biosynthesis
MSRKPKGSRKTYRMLVITPAEKLASYQIGIRQPFELLKKQGAIHYAALTEQTVTEQAIQEADLVVFLRNTSPAMLDLMNTAKKLGKGTIYTIDDHFLHLPPNRGFGIAMTEPERRRTFVDLMKNANIVRVGSPYFAELIRREYNPNVACIEAGVDFDWIDKAGAPTRNKRDFIIGYEGSYKEEDFEPVIPALQRILREYPQAVLEFHGFIPNSFVGHSQVVYFAGGHDYKEYLHLLRRREWDIGLAPLQDTLYNRCKSNNKFREYSACGFPGIFSDVATYSYCIRHKETGLLVPHTTSGWYDGIKLLIEDSHLRERIKQQSGQTVREHYTMERCAANWLSLLDSMPTKGVRS